MIQSANRLLVNPWLAMAVFLLWFGSCGCRKQTPVNEVSAGESGIDIVSFEMPILSTDWPAWRGPETNGVSADEDVPTQWSDSTNIIWASNIPGRGHSSPVVVGDSVYLATADDQLQKQFVMAYDRLTGEEKWRRMLHQSGFPSSRDIHHKATNANGTVACDTQRIYTAFLNNHKITASAIDLAGEIIWQRELGAFDSKFGYAPSPILYKSAVIFAADNQGGGYLAALDGKTGQIAWRIARPAISTYSSPIIATIGGRDQLVISGCDQVASYDPETGSNLWSTPCIAQATCGTAVCSDTKIYASGGYPGKETVCLSADGTILWSDRTKIYEPSMVLYQDALFAVTDGGVAYCWDADTGDVHWKKRLGGSFSASPIVCNGLIYVPNLDGDTIVFKAATEKFELVAQNRIGNDCYSSPAVSGGQIFLRVGVGTGPARFEKLICIGNDQP